MTNLPIWLLHALTIADRFKYPLFFIGTIIEGPILMVVSGTLIRYHLAEPVPLFIALASGDLVADVGWYYVGYFFLGSFLRRRGHLFSVTPEIVERARRLFHRYHARILLISKMTMGFGMALGTLMVAGATRVSFRTYMIMNIIGEIVFVGILLGIGYFFGHITGLISEGFRTVALVSAIAVTGAALYGFSRYVRSKLLTA